jgi:hypothetical protein
MARARREGRGIDWSAPLRVDGFKLRV